jgi:putative glycosyltransferase (TIGR04372 family)
MHKAARGESNDPRREKERQIFCVWIKIMASLKEKFQLVGLIRAYLKGGFPARDYLARKTEIFLLIPLATLLFPLSRLLLGKGCHIWPVFTERLGHQCLEADCAIRWSRLHFGESVKVILVSRTKELANSSLYTFFPRGVFYFQGGLAYSCAVVLTFFNLYRVGKEFCRVPMRRQTYRSIVEQSLQVFQMGEARRLDALRLVNDMLKNSQVLNRDSAVASYCVFNFRHPYENVPGDRLQEQRCSHAIHLEMALKYLCLNGVVPVLTGNPPLQDYESLSTKFYIDYASSPWKSDANDVLLSGNADFCLGSTSGLTLLSSIFGVPCVVHNQVPYREYWYSLSDIVVPKLMRCKHTGALLPFSVDRVNQSLRSHYLMDAGGLEFVYEESSAEDILDAVVEICQQLALVPPQVPVSGLLGNCRLSLRFRQKYAHLLPVQD